MAKGLRDAQGQLIQCSETIWGAHMFSYRCSRNATTMRGDKPYCGFHDPVRRVEKRKATQAAWDRARAEKEAYHAKRKVEFVQRIIEIGKLDDFTDSRYDAAEALVDEIIDAGGLSWWR